jgi:regulator of cell morphogenesis and NO signaling
LQEACANGGEAPHGCFGSVANPVAMMNAEHDSAGEVLREMRRLSRDFKAPEGACPTWLGFYRGLEEFEQDLHRHIHLENNILFPKALEMEAAGRNCVLSQVNAAKGAS